MGLSFCLSFFFHEEGKDSGIGEKRGCSMGTGKIVFISGILGRPQSDPQP